MRKFLASIMALSLVGATVSFNAYAENEPSIRVEAHKYAKEDGNVVYELNSKYEIGVDTEMDDDGCFYNPETEDFYLITVSVDNVNLYNPNGARDKGYALSNIEVYLKVTSGKENVVRTEPFSYASTKLLSASFTDDYFCIKGAQGAVYPKAGVASSSAPITSAENYAAAIVVVKKDSHVAFEAVKNANIGGINSSTTVVFDTTAAGTLTGTGEEFYFATAPAGEYAGLCTMTETVTVGTAPVVPEPEEPEEPEDPAPAKPVITGNTDKKAVTAETAKGIVWNNVTIEDVTKGINWKVIFTDSSLAEDNTATFNLNLNNKEYEGDISFAVVLKTDKNAENITMSFDYTDAPAE